MNFSIIKKDDDNEVEPTMRETVRNEDDQEYHTFGKAGIAMKQALSFLNDNKLSPKV